MQVIIDKETGRSKGYGFVKFTNSRSYDAALAEASGQVCPPSQHKVFLLKGITILLDPCEC